MPSPPSIDTFRVKKLVQIVIVNSGSLGAAQIEVFDLFFQLGGSKWTVVMLYELYVGPACGSWDQIRPPGALRGPPGPSEDLVGPKKGLFGPLWVLKWPQSGPTSHIIMYYACGDCFKATWTLLGCLGRHGSISASGG